MRHTLPAWRAQGPDLLSRIGGLCGRGLVSSLGLWAMEASADSAGGYSGPSQESKIPESSGAGHWDSNAPKHLSMPRSGCRIKLSLCSFLSCPSLSPPHAQLVPGQQIAVPSRGAMSSGLSHSPGSGGYGRASRGVRAVQGHKSLAWVWAQSQRAHLESCGQGGPTA